MAHHVEAHYDDNDMLFLPPSRTLGFNPKLRLNDSLLAQSYIEAYDISYPEAMRRIEGEVEELKEHLANSGSYELNSLGTLTVNAEGNYEFAPCEAGILSPELYGLGATFLQKLGDRRLIPNVEAQAALTVQLAENNAEAVLDSLPDTADDSQQRDDSQILASTAELIEFEDDNTISLKFSWIRNAVAVAAAAILFFFIVTPVANSDLSSTTMSNFGGKVLYKLMPKDSNVVPATLVSKSSAEEAEGEQKEQENTVVNKNVVDPTGKVVEEPALADNTDHSAAAAGYTIVLASQVKRSNAEDFVEQLRKACQLDARLYFNNNIVRVVVGNFATESEAQQQLNRIQRIEGLEDAWIYKIKP
jgi:cell division septation protein DedD